MKHFFAGCRTLVVLWLLGLAPAAVAQLHRPLAPEASPRPSATPFISGFEPTGAPAGTVVSIKGTSFTGTTTVKFGGVSTGSAFRVVSSTLLVAEVPPGAVTGPITVGTLTGTTYAEGTSAATFTVGDVPVIESMTPTSGPAGTNVVLTGRGGLINFSINVNGTPVTTYTSPSGATRYRTGFVVPAGATTGAVTLSLTPGGSAVATAPGTFTVTPTAPGISDVASYVTAGIAATITGVNFTGATAVKFNGIPAASFVVNSATQISAVPAAGVTAGYVTVQTPSGTAVSSDQYFVQGTQPVVTAQTPTSGLPGTAVTITGTNLATAKRVEFNAFANALFTPNAAGTQITAVVPRNATGAGRLLVIGSGIGNLTTNFTISAYTAPTITSLNFTSGVPGTRLRITGTGFSGTSLVTFTGGVTAVVTLTGTTELTVTVPATAKTGPVYVSNSNAVITGPTFTVLPAPPTITSFSPTSAAVGASVILTGTGFSTTLANNTVYFGAVKAAVTAATATSLTCTVPVGATYAPPTVLVAGQQGTARLPFLLTYTGGAALTAASYGLRTNLTTGTRPAGVVLADFNADGKADLAVANQGSASVSVFRNTSVSTTAAPTFAAKTDISTIASPQGLAAGDVDGDGKIDLVVAGNGGGTNGVAFIRNTTTAGATTLTFAAPVTYSNTSFAPSYGVALRDYDLDGYPEIFVSNYGSNTLTFFRNLGSGTFGATSSSWSVGTRPRGVALADFDADGKPDLLAPNAGSSNLTVLPNSSTPGTLSVSTLANLSTSATPYAALTGDFDADGKVDIASTSLGSNDLRLHRNGFTSGALTSAAFATTVASAAGSAPVALALADFDGGGKVDVAVAQFGADQAAILRNVYAGTFAAAMLAAPVGYGVGTQPQAIAAGDLNGDGRPEIITSSAATNSLSILTNSLGLPTITSFTPAFGLVGSTLTVTGNNLSSPTSATIGGGAATVGTSSATSVTLTVASTSLSGAISITTAAGTATSATGFMVLGVRPAPAPAAEPTMAALSLYPNPASGQTTVLLDGIAPGTLVEVQAPSGRVVFSHRLTAERAALPLSLANLPLGIYTVRAGEQVQRLVVE